jgi:KDO2-lipid IV(A) lauroyltransferase
MSIQLFVKLIDWVLHFGFYFYRFITFLPFNWLTVLGKMLGRIAMWIVPNRVHITHVNLNLCFPELDAAIRRRLVTQHFESLGVGFFDMGLAWWAADARLQSLIHVSGAENAVAAYQQRRGVIFITAHFIALEIGGRVLSSLVPLNPVYRPHRNLNLDKLIMQQRLQRVPTVIPRNNVRLLLQTLRNGGCIWFAPDQNFSHKCYVFSPFFGILAATNTATSRFAQLSGALVVPFVVFRRKHSVGYDIIIEPPLENFPSGDVQQDTNRINAVFETWIRQTPTQYLWSHRRFKDRPSGEAKFY